MSTLVENDRKITYIQTEAKIEPPQYLSIDIIPPISLPLWAYESLKQVPASVQLACITGALRAKRGERGILREARRVRLSWLIKRLLYRLVFNKMAL